MGFCIFNHVAIAANYLRKNHGLERIAIIDWDVHHGNGTEGIFAGDPGVFYVSLHERGSYPFSGAEEDRGTGEGIGTTLNLPLPPGSGGELALATWDEMAGPALDDFRPEFVLISAGFDARKDDPLGGLKWEDETFAEFTRRLVALAEKHAAGRVVSSLEGGYNPPGLASAALAHVRALA
jgi:acetoin utilization deacetylase AcuC-like enzyme